MLSVKWYSRNKTRLCRGRTGVKMQITWVKRGRTLCASLRGELDQHCAADVRAKLNALLADEGVTRMELDLGGVTFMDSAGIGVLLGRYRILAARGGSMDVLNAPRSVERILRMAGVYKCCTKEEYGYEK